MANSRVIPRSREAQRYCPKLLYQRCQNRRCSPWDTRTTHRCHCRPKTFLNESSKTLINGLFKIHQVFYGVQVILLLARASSHELADSEVVSERLLAGLPGAEQVLVISSASLHLFLAVRHCSSRISLPNFSARLIISLICSCGSGGRAMRNCCERCSAAICASWAHSYARSCSRQHREVSSRYSRLSSRRELKLRRWFLSERASSRRPVE